METLGTGNSADFTTEYEIRTIVTQLEQLKANKINILAKSIGTFVLGSVVKQSPKLSDNINKIILCGVPLNDLEVGEWNVYKSFHEFDKSRITCFQNSEDPHANFAQVSQFFKDNDIEIPLIKKLADNHDYCYSSDFKAFLSA